MNNSKSELISRYFDNDLSDDEVNALQQWLDRDLSHTKQFAEAAMLHNQLHAQVAAQIALREPLTSIVSTETQSLSPTSISPPSAASRLSRTLMMTALAATVLFMLWLWRGTQTAQAGPAELQKVIAASLLSVDSSYAISVEANVIDGARPRHRPPEDRRPPKPPLDGARLVVRGPAEFVLERTTIDGELFVTGCDGKTSWMVPPAGPVRVSSDLKRFNRDVPGHEFSMSLCNLPDALTQLNHAYELYAVPSDVSNRELLDRDFANGSPTASESTRLLVATKKRGFPGPRRVEISYGEVSGQIEQLRFVDMPYGPDRLTVRLSLVETNSTTTNFFHHSAHHAIDRTVASE